MTEPLRIAFVAGVTPDKWARVWRERHPSVPLELTPVEESDQRSVLTTREADMCFVRLPVETEGIHLIPLYEEQPVVVVAKDHPAAVYDEIHLADLADEQLVAGDVPGWDQLCTATRLHFSPMSIKDAIEVVGSGTGIVIVPMSVARLHRRKDVVHLPVLDVPTTRIGLAWPDGADDPRLEDFIGIVRGRRANSSRGQSEAGTTTAAAPKAAPKKASSRPGSKSGTNKSGGRKPGGTRGQASRTSGSFRKRGR